MRWLQAIGSALRRLRPSAPGVTPDHEKADVRRRQARTRGDVERLEQLARDYRDLDRDLRRGLR